MYSVVSTQGPFAVLVGTPADPRPSFYRQVYRKPDEPLVTPAGSTTAGTEAQAKFEKEWEDVCITVHDALARLNLIVVAVRKASAQRSDHSIATLTVDDDVVFRTQLALWVRYRLPAARKALCQQLGDSIAIRRRMILQTKLHANRLATRRIPETPPKGQLKAGLEFGSAPPGDVPKGYPADGLTRNITKSLPQDSTSTILGNLRSPAMRASTTSASSVSTRKDDLVEYPPAPWTGEGATSVQCPFCLRPLELGEKGKASDVIWRSHVEEHVKPYACLFPKCAEALVFFASLPDWNNHMESVHSTDWMRKVHNVVWCCGMKHESSEAETMFETEQEWRKHCQDLNLHPGRAKVPTKAQLDAASSRSQQISLRGEFVCPLCERIPEKIQHLARKKEGRDIHRALVHHVAAHLRSLSLMALPSFEDDIQETPGAESVVLGDDSFKRLLVNGSSAPQPPSGRGYVDGALLPADSKSIATRDNELPPTDPEESLWDEEYDDYEWPDEPPSPVYDQWLEEWSFWRNEHDPFPPSFLEIDPILTHFKAAKGIGMAQSRDDKAGEWTFDVNWKNVAGRTQLSFTAEAGKHEIVQELLHKGAELEAADQDGKTPLLWAASSGKEETVKVILRNGARIETPDRVYGRTPLLWAAAKGYPTVVKILLDCGAEVDAADKSGWTPIAWAAVGGKEETIKLLVQAGANVQQPDPKYGRTPLLWAAVKGHEAIVRLLLDLEVDVNTVDLKRRRTPLSWAAESGHGATVGLLLSRGADVEAINRRSMQTPISLAAENGHEAIVEALLDHGADIKAQDRQGWTALTWAIRKGHDGVVRRLLSSLRAKNP